MAPKIRNIEEIKLMLPDYVMDRLNPDEKKIVEGALESSPELKLLAEELSSTFNFVGSVKPEEPPSHYWSTLLPRIHERIESKQRSGYFVKLVEYWKIAVPIAAVILIALVYYLVINRQTETTITEKNESIQKDSITHKVQDENIKKEIVKENEVKGPVKKPETTKNKLPVIRHNQFTDFEDNKAKDIDEAQKKEELPDNESYTEVNIEEESVFGEAAGGFDEETESALNKLDNREEVSFIKELEKSNF